MAFVDMDFKDGETDKDINFARMCLVREASTSPLQRLEDALNHLNDATSDDNVSWELDQDKKAWKEWWVTRLQTAITNIERTAA